MSRRLSPTAECAVQTHILLTQKQLEAIDVARGPKNRSEFIRAAIDAVLAAEVKP